MGGVSVDVLLGPQFLSDGTPQRVKCLSGGLRDECIPFAKESLRNIFRHDEVLPMRLLKLQPLVQSNVRSMAFDDSDDPTIHRNVDDGSLVFKNERALGIGLSGRVDQVSRKAPNRTFARKLISRGSTSEEQKIALQCFLTEVQALRKVEHNHLVRLLGSYTDDNYYALLLPTARCNLNDLLKSRTTPEKVRKLSSFFGCLATAMSYLHSCKIRHKDIKPGNILITEDDRVVICDFGSARDWSSTGDATTKGPITTGVTPRYL